MTWRRPCPIRKPGARRATGVAKTYDRIARFYDVYDAPMDWMGGATRRKRVIDQASGRVLEVGIGTGRNLPHYNPEAQLVGIDISARMLARARSRTETSPGRAALSQADVERLPFPAETFDSVTATCVFCSVSDPVAGLRELARVVRAEGRVLLLEHVRPRNRMFGVVFDALSPLTRRLFGPSINRRTEANVLAAGLDIIDVRCEGIWREIEAKRSTE